MMKKPKKPKLTHQEFLEKLKAYLDKHGKNGSLFIAKYEKWLSIYSTNHEQAYDDIIKDERFKLEAGLISQADLEQRKAERKGKRKKKGEEGNGTRD